MASFGKVRIYPDGSMDIIAASREIFDTTPKPPRKRGEPKGKAKDRAQAQPKPDPKPENIERAMRRARANVRRLALANEFEWFVTLTLDPAKINRYDPVEVVKKMGQWADNRVRRKGLKYILVPEHHKDGAIHFHGFFNGALQAEDSGLRDKNGRQVFNLPDWTLGFTRAVRLYGDYHAAVGYTCKYIGKGTGKIGGRWYYSGGDLVEPEEREVDMPYYELMDAYREEFAEQYGAGWFKATPVAMVAGVNGIRLDKMKGAET